MHEFNLNMSYAYLNTVISAAEGFVSKHRFSNWKEILINGFRSF